MDPTQKITDKVFLQNCINLFIRRKNLQNSINEKCEMINRNNCFLRRSAGYTATIVFTIISGLLIIGAVIAFFFGKMMFGTRYQISYDPNASLFYSNYDWYYYFNLWIVILAIVFLICGFLFIFVTKLRIKKLNAKKRQAVEANEMISAQIADHYNEFQNIEQSIYATDILHPEYWCVGDYILEYIVLGRASNIMEAINLFEHECQVNIQLQQNLQMIQATEKIHSQLVVNGLISIANTAAIVGSVNSASSRITSAVNSLKY